VLDLSSSGLSIRTKLDIAQGDEVELVIEPAIQFQAIAWRTKRTQSGFIIGLMLSNVCPAYEGLVERHAARRPAAPPAATATATAATEHPAPAAAPPPPPPPPPAELWWRLRVKDCDGNRTRVVAIVAASREEAIAGTLAETGGGWEILEAEIAPRAPTTKKASSQNT
jgi:pyruvate/2-oxoglutarate dehydrogenase complex dihydrolipoamide acyltransferase (E2) component